jgi:WD40 repeat protein
MHAAQLDAVAFSPDGRYVASGGSDMGAYFVAATEGPDFRSLHSFNKKLNY